MAESTETCGYAETQDPTVECSCGRCHLVPHFDQLVEATAARLADTLRIDGATAWNALYPPNGALGAMFVACPLCRGAGCYDCTDGWVTAP